MMERISLALAQISCKRGDKEQNIAKIENYTLKAKDHGADLVIFPELCLTGYVLKDRVYELAEVVTGNSVKKIEEISRKTGVHVVFGMPTLVENTKATLHNTAVFVGPEGLIGTYDKMYLPTHSVFEEKRYFRPGYQPAAFDTSIGKIGICICYDVFFPETTRLARMAGAQLIVCISASPAVRRSYFEILTSARALENTVYLAYVNLVGIEDGLQFWGGSRVINPTGDIVAKAKYDEEDLVLCEVDFGELRSAEAFIPTLRDLRPELFEKLRDQSERL